MKLEQQIISLDLAKELAEVMKEKGITSPESLYWHIRISDTPDGRQDWLLRNMKWGSGSQEEYPAYTVAELGGMLPEFPCGELMNTIPYLTIGHRWRVDLDDEGMLCSEENEANARCKMLIYLLKNNLITL